MCSDHAVKYQVDIMSEYQRAVAVLASGTREQLEALRSEIETFPHGVDSLIGRRWIMTAIGSGSGTAVEWMLERGVELKFCEADGYTPLHLALERTRGDKLKVLERLLAAGASVNLKGINDWTPAHMAAASDDVEALRILVRHGADLSIRTTIDDYATPLEEAQNLGKLNAAKYLASVV
jgi:ankyrin repeat protein